MDLSLVPTTGVRLTVQLPDGAHWSRGHVRIESVDDGSLRAWRRRDIIATGVPVEVNRQNARVVEVKMSDGQVWLTSSCGCGS